MAARQRARVLNRIADGIERRGARIAELETFDTGLPITQARGQAERAAENFRFFADMIVTAARGRVPDRHGPARLRAAQAGRRRPG